MPAGSQGNEAEEVTVDTVLCGSGRVSKATSTEQKKLKKLFENLEWFNDTACLSGMKLLRYCYASDDKILLTKL